ncbi:hypothetical protein [Arthrobacter sp. 2MCAF14]|uniref:hypothetical protein n=1 Tax=Arthrobacter sp. 2MCAF14 TaxID=3232982 RepID=UPI003F90791B
MRKWSSILIRFASAQGLVQILGFITGIAIVSAIDKASYAHYTVVVALLAAMTALSESGLSSVLLSMGGKFRNSPERLSSLFSAGLIFRRKLGLVVGVVGIAVLFYALIQTGSGVAAALGYVVLASLTFVPILSKGVFQVHLRLKLDVSSLQRIAVLSSSLRFALIIPLVFTHSANVLLLLILGLIIAVVEAWLLRRKSASEIDYSSRVIYDDVSVFRRSLKQTMPMNLPYVMQGQLLYLLLGISGSAFILADIAALSRFGLVFAVLNSVLSDIGAGFMARSQGNKRAVLRLYVVILGGYILCAAVLVGLLAIFAQPLVGLLGAQYAGLEAPLIVVACGSALINIGNALVTLNHARGWLKWSWVFVPMTAFWCISGLLWLDLRNVFLAAVFMAAQAIPLIATQMVCLLSGSRGQAQLGAAVEKEKSAIDSA